MTVHYDAKNHAQIIFTLSEGSVWRKCYLACLLNVGVTILLYVLKEKYDINLAINDKGHSFLSILTSFLVVTRMSIIYSRFWASREVVAKMYRSGRRLASKAAVYTMFDSSDKAQIYREQIMRKLLKLVGSSTYIIQDNAMSIALVEGCDVEDVKRNHFSSKNAIKSNSHELEILQDPDLLGLNLHATIVDHAKYLSKPLLMPHELDLLTELDNYLHSYSTLIKTASSPFPFPVVQMTYTLVGIYLFTLPFVLCDDIRNKYVAATVILFLTYGFMGLTLVATELQDPFNGDPNDFEMDKYRDRVANGVEADLSCVFTTLDDWYTRNDEKHDDGQNKFAWASIFGTDMSYSSAT
mmetsp:Transcript_34413/g.34596  ORF Transcript_34413/g.34596 Transcript_34413/m.34596 type:complete len:353 (-) Transcript_34413:414-1472(-)|eukprot:CAMPEP_0171298034 /NCGR_PEP_ID=MMETSP0816-20121228/6803_1 /TAXON_ID=420281 /ORGANISM="Proboscia inermis, Strain CCAP1064/1" /LENGTH=352 /DNA_ID=CAMNT_0011772791 /DNA_START=66 /DNA_END=1124 /DNA_ORIENTATION=-